ncbi:MAG: hypothetical protein LBL13_01480 [Bacteroidales bacterium]|jgi:5-methylcytosine-specific restriction endonuclease McrA|nr:hypothetical protein [Bacteroidales bacterium]
MYRIDYNDKAANEFFDEHKHRILESIHKYREYYFESKYLIWEGTTGFVKDFLDFYSSEVNLKKLIVGKPNELLKIVQCVQYECNRSSINHFEYRLFDPNKQISQQDENIIKNAEDIEKRIKIRKRKSTSPQEQDDLNRKNNVMQQKHLPDFRKILNRIFVDHIYDHKSFCKSEFVRKKGLRVCPYCGRNYIFSVKSNGIDVKPHIDHFIPKAEFPFLSFSYYNLIPSCETCNVSCKKEKKPLTDDNMSYKILNPYEYKDNSIFSFMIKNADVFSDLIFTNEQNIQVVTNINNDKDFFAIKSLYEKHNDLAHELLIRKQFWATDTCQKYYQDLLQKDPNVKAKMILAFLGYYNDFAEHGKHSFSKFFHDIAKHYDDLVAKGKNHI